MVIMYKIRKIKIIRKTKQSLRKLDAIFTGLQEKGHYDFTPKKILSSNSITQFSSVQLLSLVQLFSTP